MIKLKASPYSKLRAIADQAMANINKHVEIETLQRELVRAYIERALLEAHAEGTQHGISRLSEALKEATNERRKQDG